MNEESCAALLMAIDVAPSTRPQYARMLRSMLEMNRTPLDMVILWLKKVAARSETKQACPLTKDGPIYPQPDRLEVTCCLTTRVDNGEALVRDCGLNSQQFHNGAGRDRNFGLVRGAEDGESGSPPRL
ncbi:trans-sialidase [Trypanosoma cruzi]|nr:trans-sialidase [Trypanosoma cruzi]